jgi:Ca2+-binding RTX toxin-like protein
VLAHSLKWAYGVRVGFLASQGRRFAAAAVICALVVLGPGAALAAGAIVSKPVSTLDVTDGGSEANQITIDRTPAVAGMEVQDLGVAPTAGAGCQPGSTGNRVHCPDPITQIAISAGAGDDSVVNQASLPTTISGGDGADNLTGSGGPETIDGGPGNDRMTGGADVDDLHGGDGDDFISTAGEFTDRVTCGPGFDTVDADDSDQVAADCERITGRTGGGGAGGGDGAGGGGGGSSGRPPLQVFPLLQPGACERVVNGTDGHDIALNGGEQGDTLLGRGGNDLISGLGGDDCLFGGDGRDRLSGGAGDDFVAGERDVDRLAGDDGDDRMTGGDGVDRVAGGAGADTMAGGAGRDRMSGGGQRDLMNGGSGPDRIVAGGGNDSIDGHSGRDRISVRGGGRDRVKCGAGRDTVIADRRDRIADDCEAVRRSARRR